MKSVGQSIAAKAGRSERLAQRGASQDNVISVGYQLAASLTGQPTLQFHGRDLSHRLGNKPRALVYMVLSELGRRVPRHYLAQTLWSGQDDGAARANLRLGLSRLRQQLPGLVQADNQSVWFEPSDVQTVDVCALRDVFELADDASLDEIRSVLENWRGPFLDGFDLRGAPEFEDWLRRARERVQMQAVSLVQIALARLPSDTAVSQRIWFVQRWVALDETNESAHHELMSLYQLNGERTLAIEQYEKLRALLLEKLGARPSAATYELYRKIHSDAPRNSLLTEQDSVTSSSRSATELPGSTRRASVTGIGKLPTPGRALVGRHKLLADMSELYENPDCRLMTLHGPGGIGKTRVALAFASNVDEPVVFVTLSGLTNVASDAASDVLVMQISSCLHASFNAPESVRKQLLRYLSSRKLLLILDSFELLLGAQSLLADILDVAPDVRILITTRERPDVKQQWIVEVPGFPSPDEATESNLVSIESASGVEFFDAVAQRVLPGFDVSQNLAAISRIIALVQGSPLGIELAANWVRSLPCEEIVRRLESGLDLLTVSSDATTGRHSSMRAVLDSSWSLLDESAQRALAGMSLFSASFDSAAALEVAGASALQLARLVDRSWLIAIDAYVGTRYLMHDLVRHYASERLRDDGDRLEQVRELYARYFQTRLTLMHEGRGLMDEATARRIDPDRQNIKAAWHWLKEHCRADEIVDFVEICHDYHVSKGWLGEAAVFLHDALEMPGGTLSDRSRWHCVLSQDHWQLGLVGKSNYYAEQVLLLNGEKVPRGKFGSALAVLGSAVTHFAGFAYTRSRIGGDPSANDMAHALARLASVGYLAGASPAKLTHHAMRCSDLSDRYQVGAGIVWSNSFLAMIARRLRQSRLGNLYAARASNALPLLGNGGFDAMATLNFGIERYIAGQWDTATDLLDRSISFYATTGQLRVAIDGLAVKGLMGNTRRQKTVADAFWGQLYQEGSQAGDRLVKLWARIGAAESDLASGVAPDLAELTQSTVLLPAGTRHEQARLDAAIAGGSLLEADYELASYHANKALITLQAGKFLPFYDSEGCANTAHVLLSLAERNSLQQSTRTAALDATRLACQFGRVHPFFLPRALIFMARAERLKGCERRVIRLATRARKTAESLGLQHEAEVAGRYLTPGA